MYSQGDIDDAVAAGALSAQAAESLRNFVDGRRSFSNIDEENFRLLTGFNDIFVNIATWIMLGAVAWLVSLANWTLAGAAVAAVAWPLALFFTEQRRMALPSITLLLAFVGGIGVTAGALVGSAGAAELGVTAGALAGAGAAWVHWRRFRVPITVAAGAAAAAAILISLVAQAGDGLDSTLVLVTILATGIAVFILAMWWDSSDPARVTRRSDIAFWLHLLASPLLVHPVFALLGLSRGGGGAGEAGIVILLYALLGIAALAIDRRALLVSALLYVLWALANLFEEFGTRGTNVALTALIIGSALLLLSAFWNQARRQVVGLLPPSWRRYLPLLDRQAVTPQPAG